MGSDEKDFQFALPLGRTQRRQVHRFDRARSSVFDAFSCCQSSCGFRPSCLGLFFRCSLPSGITSGSTSNRRKMVERAL